MQASPVKHLREDRTSAASRSSPRHPSGKSQSDPATRPRSWRSPRLNVVLICHFGRTGYNILRSLRGVNARVYLVHDDRSASLKYSRYCKVIHAAKDLSTADPEQVLRIVNDLHLKVGLASVIASDVESLAFLSQIKDRLLAPAFPMAGTDTIATLHDKWKFHQLCESAGVALPKALYFRNKPEFDPGLIERELGFPVIAKPVDSYGQRGIKILHDQVQVQNWLSSHGDFDHRPTIVQEYIEGQDWALSIFAQDGVIKHWVSWVCPGQLDAGYGIGRFLATEFRPRDDLFTAGQKIVAATNFSGVANFDARYDDRSGVMRMLECNPRFFNRMSAARLSGVDFVRPGLPLSGTQPVSLGDVGYYPWQELFTRRGIRRMLQGRWRIIPLIRDLYEMGTDPIPPIARKLGKEDEQD